jgi:hypothetical protein
VTSDSTLALIKEALKLMAWTKAKTVIVIGACALAAGTTIIITLCNLPRPIRSIPTDWTIIRGDSEQWNWANGKINAHSTTGETILASGKEYGNVTLSAIASTTNREASLMIRLQDANNGYLIIFAPASTPRDDAGHISLIKKTDGNEAPLASYQGRVFSSMGQSAKIAVTARGPLIEVRLNDNKVMRVKDTTFATGLIGLRIYGSPDYPCDASFASVTFH